MKRFAKKFLAAALALVLCVSLGVPALAHGPLPSDPEYYDPYYNPYDDDYFFNGYLILTGSGYGGIGDIVDVGLDTNVDYSSIFWTYDSNYLSHQGGGVFRIIDADSSDRRFTVTATYDVGYAHLTDSATITVSGYRAPVSAFYVTLDDSSMSLEVGGESYLQASGYGGETPYYFTWTSENNSVARVSSGYQDDSYAIITAVGSGTTRIKVQGRDYYGNSDVAYCTVRVTGNSARVTSIDLSSHSLTMQAWSSRTLDLYVVDSRADYTVTWSSSNDRIATVSGRNNHVTVESLGVGGTATIQATVRDNTTGATRTDKCTVTVEAEKTSTYNPSTNISLGTTTAGSVIYDSLRNQYRSVYNVNLPDTATISFGTSTNSSIATRRLANGQPVQVNKEYTMAEYKGMYTEPFASGTFITPYTLRYNNKNLAGNISVEITPAYVSPSINLENSQPYAFNAALPGGNAVTVISAALRNTLTEGLSWSYLRFDTVSSSIGTLYANSSLTPLTSSTNVTAATLGSLYFVPASAGAFSTAFTAYNSSNGVLLNGYLYIVVPATVTGVPQVMMTNQSLSVNGAPVTTEIYNINGENYFKLRDVAMMLNGTGSQFAVGYDEATRTITVTTGAAYTPNGSELIKGADKSPTCVIGNMPIFVNGGQVSPTAYNIGNNNFLRLRDLGDIIGFNVGYDEATRTILVTSR